jgi:hypothetical protein
MMADIEGGKTRSFRALCLLVALIAGCGGDGGGPTAPETSATLRVNNTSASLSITEINVSRCEIADWGSNRIGSPVTPGHFVELELAPNCYDARIFLNNFQHFEFFDILLLSGGTETIVIFDQ